MAKKKEAAPAPKEEYNHKAIYIGRVFQDKKLFKKFLRLPDKEPMLFAKTQNVIIGCVYKCGKDCMPRQPERVEEEVDIDPVWSAQDAIALSQHAEFCATRRAEEKLKRKSGYWMTEAKKIFRNLTKGMEIYERRALARLLVEDSLK